MGYPGVTLKDIETYYDYEDLLKMEAILDMKNELEAINSYAEQQQPEIS